MAKPGESTRHAVEDKVRLSYFLQRQLAKASKMQQLAASRASKNSSRLVKIKNKNKRPYRNFWSFPLSPNFSSSFAQVAPEIPKYPSDSAKSSESYPVILCQDAILSVNIGLRAPCTLVRAWVCRRRRVERPVRKVESNRRCRGCRNGRNGTLEQAIDRFLA